MKRRIGVIFFSAVFTLLLFAGVGYSEDVTFDNVYVNDRLYIKDYGDPNFQMRMFLNKGIWGIPLTPVTTRYSI
ncbi:MAG: hypothetical protein HY761_08580 [Candidatus Omnitrophica bacterium]|nr:hypothetical protein [Candidatus Omnitrophota bacterium]